MAFHSFSKWFHRSWWGCHFLQVYVCREEFLVAPGPCCPSQCCSDLSSRCALTGRLSWPSTVILVFISVERATSACPYSYFASSCLCSGLSDVLEVWCQSSSGTSCIGRMFVFLILGSSCRTPLARSRWFRGSPYSSICSCLYLCHAGHPN